MVLVSGKLARPSVDAISAAAGLLGAFPQVTPLESGSQNYAWRLSHRGGSLVLRMAKQPDDSGLMTDLRVRNSFARPDFVPGNQGSGRTSDRRIWLIDDYVLGLHPARGEIDEAVIRQIGTVLGQLHQIPVSGWGRIESEDAGVRGRASSVWQGLTCRFDLGPVPDDLNSLSRMVLPDQPELSAASAMSLKRLQDALLRARPAVCHADLHERQIFADGGSLLGIIDFGHALISAPCIDFASFAYFHGLDTLPALRDGYLAAGLEPASPADCLNATVLIAIHHLYRSSLPGKAHRRKFAVQRLHDVIGCEP